MSYLVTKEQAQQVLAAVKANPVLGGYRDNAGLPLPDPKIKRIDDAFFSRDNEATDNFYLVWPNGYNEPVAAVSVMMRCSPGRWPIMFLTEYEAWAGGHRAPMDGTDEGIRWKD